MSNDINNASPTQSFPFPIVIDEGNDPKYTNRSDIGNCPLLLGDQYFPALMPATEESFDELKEDPSYVAVKSNGLYYGFVRRETLKTGDPAGGESFMVSNLSWETYSAPIKDILDKNQLSIRYKGYYQETIAYSGGKEWRAIIPTHHETFEYLLDNGYVLVEAHGRQFFVSEDYFSNPPENGAFKRVEKMSWVKFEQNDIYATPDGIRFQTQLLTGDIKGQDLALISLSVPLGSDCVAVYQPTNEETFDVMYYKFGFIPVEIKGVEGFMTSADFLKYGYGPHAGSVKVKNTINWEQFANLSNQDVFTVCAPPPDIYRPEDYPPRHSLFPPAGE